MAKLKLENFSNSILQLSASIEDTVSQHKQDFGTWTPAFIGSIKKKSKFNISFTLKN